MTRPEPFAATGTCGCGKPLAVTAWTTGTPGLVVLPDDPCGHVYEDGAWGVWHSGTGTRLMGGFSEPEAAMWAADELGAYHDWDTPDANAALNATWAAEP